MHQPDTFALPHHDAHEAVRPVLGRAVVAAALAAALGAAAWALMLVATDHSIGFAAVGLGILAGRLVHRLTGGARGLVPAALSALAVAAALVVGKYAAFAYVIHQFVEKRFGPAAGASFGYLSRNTFDAFHANLGDQFSGFYLLWVALGIAAAWRIAGPAPRA